MTNSIRKLSTPRFFSEAHAIMDRHNLPDSAFDSVHAQLVHEAFQQESNLFLKAIVSVTALAMPRRWERHGDGPLVQVDDGMTESMREQVAELRAHIAQVAFKYYGERSVTRLDPP